VLALPIDPLLPDIVKTLARDGALVLEAPPGAGKTTRVPRAILDADAVRGQIVVLEPRRLAARMAARRVAEELGDRVGGVVGYQVRFEDVSSARTRIRFVTEGVLTRRLLGDPRLDGIGAVVLDEFHERHLHGDVALALVRRLRETARPDLRVVVMSATLAAQPIADYLGCTTLRAEGRLYEVAVEHLPAPDDRPLDKQVASAVRRLVGEGLDGDVLVFLPGAGEIRRALETCAAIAEQADLLLVPLHGDLSPAEQDRAVGRADRRKIILSTNVAESSVTIDGVVAVVDSGLARVAKVAPWSGLPVLRIERISRASATQRTGRAGRTRPGRCLRLYTRADHDTRPERDVPEIARLDLTQTWLELLASAAHLGDLRDIAWLEAPPETSVRAALELLARLGAVGEAGKVTELGRRMLRFALHPRLARLLVEAERRGVARDGAILAALVGERDLRVSSKARFGPRGAGEDRATERSDLVLLLDLFREAQASRFSASSMRTIGLDAGATLAVERARVQLTRDLDTTAPEPHEPEDCLLMSVLAGYPDRVARRLGGRRVALAGGGAAELSEESAVRVAEWMVAVDADGGPSGGPRGGHTPSSRSGTIVRLASGIDPSWLIDLFPDAVRETSDVTWNRAAERVEATERMLYDGLTLHESFASDPRGEDVSRVLAAAARERGPRAFAPEGALDRWLARARFAAEQGAVPADLVNDAAVDTALVTLCDGKRSFAELREASLLDVLQARLGPGGAARIAALAPERVTLAAGRAVRITYETGKPPWLESYLQDFFGMAASPRVAEGRVPLVLHLLAPNKRAVQVTSDLQGFWQRHYPAIRKELARKYPRHSWPEDPTKVTAPFVRPRRS
jgi:ATP-dependent helicase HrpB